MTFQWKQLHWTYWPSSENNFTEHIEYLYIAKWWWLGKCEERTFEFILSQSYPLLLYFLLRKCKTINRLKFSSLDFQIFWLLITINWRLKHLFGLTFFYFFGEANMYNHNLLFFWLWYLIIWLDHFTKKNKGELWFGFIVRYLTFYHGKKKNCRFLLSWMIATHRDVWIYCTVSVIRVL